MTASPTIERPSTWSEYAEGHCKGCESLCCSLTVEVTANDLVRLGLIPKSDVMMSPKKIARRLMTTGALRDVRPDAGLYTLAQKADGSCVFLSKERFCTVYEKRPEVCRNFPLIGPRPKFCPRKLRKNDETTS